MRPLWSMAKPYLEKALTKGQDLDKIADMVQTRIEVFPEIEEMVDFFETLPEYDPAMYVHKKMKTTKESVPGGFKRTASAVGRAGGLYQRRTVCASAFLCGEKGL